MKNVAMAIVVLLTMVGGAAALNVLPAAGTYDLDALDKGGDNTGYWWLDDQDRRVFSDLEEDADAQWYYGFDLVEGSTYAHDSGYRTDFQAGSVYLSVTGSGQSEAFELSDITAWTWVPELTSFEFNFAVAGNITGDNGTADVTIYGEGNHTALGSSSGNLTNVRADVGTVPDGGATLALLGIAGLALGAVRRARG